jgi:uncharacterized protein (TIGR00661 family)
MIAHEHDCLILAPSSVFHFMKTATEKWPRVSLSLLPSLRFHYYENGKLSYVRSSLGAAPFILRVNTLLAQLSREVEAFSPELAITDFEPLLPRLARRLRIPTLSLDHQHFLYAMDMSILPDSLRYRALFLRPSIKLFCPAADLHLVSSFFRYPQRDGTQDYRQIGVLLRQDLLNAKPRDGNHLLVYVRRSGAATWLPELAQCGLPVRVYGTEHVGHVGNVEYRPICNQRFIEDLTSCRALITTAGNQLVGEALACRKPVMTIPEIGNFEQQLNGFFLSRSGMGESLEARQFTTAEVRRFLDRIPEYQSRMSGYEGAGNYPVMSAISSMLPAKLRVAPGKVPVIPGVYA